SIAARRTASPVKALKPVAGLAWLRTSWVLYRSGEASDVLDERASFMGTSRPRNHLAARRVLKVTSGKVPYLPHRPQQRLLDTAAIERERAARVEAAAGWRVDRARHIAGEDDALAL